MKNSLSVLLSVIILLSCNNSTEEEVTTTDRTERSKNMKGHEIYLWAIDGKTVYTLLPGTNRNKDSAEIYDRSRAVEWNGIKKKIDNIDTGQYVFIKPLRADAEKISELRAYLRSKKLIVSE